ncbi:MAG TPA: hypothetical protein RMG48_19160 [Myxococcales bacterium LLY-WYZ-16_1]|nr:hypothetical protein [Myxococcales bacterium LLY-WYZ-16_1]
MGTPGGVHAPPYSLQALPLHRRQVIDAAERMATSVPSGSTRMSIDEP